MQNCGITLTLNYCNLRARLLFADLLINKAFMHLLMFQWHIYSDRVSLLAAKSCSRKSLLCHLRKVKLLPSDFVLRFLTLFFDSSLQINLFHAKCERLDLEQYCLVFCMQFKKFVKMCIFLHEIECAECRFGLHQRSF